MNQAQYAAAATALFEARRDKAPIPRISQRFDIASPEDAYAVAQINTRRALDAGNRITGRKIGLTSKAVQKQLGVGQPDYGVLFESMERLDNAELDASSLLQPKAEAEIALVVGRDISDEALSWGRFLLSIEYALPAIEIVDSAIENWDITLADTIADNASCGLYVLGTEPKRITSFSMIDCGMSFTKNNAIVATGSGAACLDSPLLSGYWLAKVMAKNRMPINAGEVILTGALGPMVVLEKGDHIDVTIGGLGRVRCRST
jgi:2-keto-4-pentenoate hydratase